MFTAKGDLGVHGLDSMIDSVANGSGALLRCRSWPLHCATHTHTHIQSQVRIAYNGNCRKTLSASPGRRGCRRRGKRLQLECSDGAASTDCAALALAVRVSPLPSLPAADSAASAACLKLNRLRRRTSCVSACDLAMAAAALSERCIACKMRLSAARGASASWRHSATIPITDSCCTTHRTGR